jgi:hypothetical protein
VGVPKELEGRLVEEAKAAQGGRRGMGRGHALSLHMCYSVRPISLIGNRSTKQRMLNFKNSGPVKSPTKSKSKLTNLTGIT